MRKKHIAITGGIGSGKTEVSKIIKIMGFPVIDADSLAKELYFNEHVKNKIIKAFGQLTYINDKPDFKYISNLIYNKKKNVDIVNTILHPLVKDLIINEYTKLEKLHDLVFTEAALIFEAGFEKLFDCIILVTAKKDVRVERVKKRNGFSEKDILLRIENQMPDETKIEKSDYIIENNTDIITLKEIVLDTINQIKKLNTE